jgi:hypothetical protein
MNRTGRDGLATHDATLYSANCTLKLHLPHDGAWLLAKGGNPTSLAFRIVGGGAPRWVPSKGLEPVPGLARKPG